MTSNEGGVPEAIKGLVFAGYGAFVYTALLLVARLNSSAVTGKFLINSAIRSMVSMLLGYIVGIVNIFLSITNGTTSLFLYFALGLFPSWALGALRRKAKEYFQPTEPGCEALPLCLVDGVDDGIIDRLSEIGVWDIQHLATAEPVELTLRTLYPFHRVLDWLDQAILIGYVKTKIAECRQQGIRSAIELATLYGDFVGLLRKEPDTTARQQRAAAVLAMLAQRLSMSDEALKAIGRSLYEDYLVNQIWDYWQNVAAGAGGPAGTEVPTGVAPPQAGDKNP